MKAEEGRGKTTEEDGDATQLEKKQKTRQVTSAESFAERLTKWELCKEGLPTRPSTLARSSPQGSFPGQEAESLAKGCPQEGDRQENPMAQGPWMPHEALRKMYALVPRPDVTKTVHLEGGLEVRLAPTPPSEAFAVILRAPVPAYHVPEGVQSLSTGALSSPRMSSSRGRCHTLRSCACTPTWNWFCTTSSARC